MTDPSDRLDELLRRANPVDGRASPRPSTTPARNSSTRRSPAPRTPGPPNRPDAGLALSWPPSPHLLSSAAASPSQDSPPATSPTISPLSATPKTPSADRRPQPPRLAPGRSSRAPTPGPLATWSRPPPPPRRVHRPHRHRRRVPHLAGRERVRPTPPQPAPRGRWVHLRIHRAADDVQQRGAVSPGARRDRRLARQRLPRRPHRHPHRPRHRHQRRTPVDRYCPDPVPHRPSLRQPILRRNSPPGAPHRHPPPRIGGPVDRRAARTTGRTGHLRSTSSSPTPTTVAFAA